MRAMAGIQTARLLQIGAILILFGMLAGCATTGATFGSGVGDTYFERPPYSAGMLVPAGTKLAHLPITYQRGAVQPSFADPAGGPGSPLAALLAEMNAYLDAFGASVRIEAGEPVGTPPDVQFGCERVPDDECRDADPRAPHRLAVGRPSQRWIAWAREQAEPAGADQLLVITLEIGNYLPRQRNLRGDKEVLLGTRNAQRVRWLTALDRPVSVLQITGALMNGDGRAVRIAAEGLAAHPTHVVAGGFGLQALITDEDIEHVRASRLWEPALRSLLEQLGAGGK
jgi:hypothetical protein